MTGGSSNIPSIRKLVEETIDVRSSQDIDPDTAVAQGAAIYCAMKLGKHTPIIHVNEVVQMGIGFASGDIDL